MKPSPSCAHHIDAIEVYCLRTRRGTFFSTPASQRGSYFVEDLEARLQLVLAVAFHRWVSHVVDELVQRNHAVACQMSPNVRRDDGMTPIALCHAVALFQVALLVPDSGGEC